jgi:hypothetical protein
MGSEIGQPRITRSLRQTADNANPHAAVLRGHVPPQDTPRAKFPLPRASPGRTPGATRQH